MDSKDSCLPSRLVLDLGRGVKMKMVLIPAGNFLMGSPPGEVLRKYLIYYKNNEGRQHRVNITKPFYMAKYEVTQEQYKHVMGKNPSCFIGKMRPVEMVSWFSANKFCRVLSSKTGKTVRLPTEAEWEYSCRAGTTTAFYSGVNYLELDDSGWTAENTLTTHPVGRKKPNAWGLYDMHGNVWEWCQDYYALHTISEVSDPQGPPNGESRILRGGSWKFFADECRAALRNYLKPGGRYNDVGFRIVIPVD